MTNTELILNMLAEASTKDISNATDPDSFEASKEVARQGGNVAKVARIELEARTGKQVVSALNAKKALEVHRTVEGPTGRKEELIKRCGLSAPIPHAHPVPTFRT